MTQEAIKRGDIVRTPLQRLARVIEISGNRARLLYLPDPHILSKREAGHHPDDEYVSLRLNLLVLDGY